MVSFEHPRDTDPSPLELALMEEAERMTGDIQTYKEILGERKLVEEANAKMHREYGGNSWSFADGIYQNPPDDIPEEIGWRIDAPLSGIEVLWARQIDAALDQKQESGKPVIMVDFGSGFGLSLMRLGAQDKYRQAIEDGNLVLVATNLGYVPTEESDTDGYTSVAKDLSERNVRGDNVFRNDEELRFIQENQKYVHFLNKSVMELEDASVKTPDGVSISLRGNTDVLSEQMSLAHTHIPDIALGIFAELLNPGGTLYLSTKKGNSMEWPQFSEIEVAGGQTLQVSHSKNPEYYEQRKMALEIGLATATRHLGLEIVDDIYLGPAVLSKHS